MNSSRRFMLLTALSCPTVLAGLAAPVEAIVPPNPSALTDKVFRHPHLHISNLELPVGELALSGRREVLAGQLSRLGAQSGLHDWRSGRWGSLVLSVPLIPGDGVGNRLGPSREIGETEAWSALSGYLQAHRGDLRIDVSELAAPRVAVFDGGALVQVHVARVVGGIPVRDSSLSAVINHGNLVLLGLQNWGAVDPTAPALSAEAAKEFVAKHLEPLAVAAYRTDARLERVPLARGQDIATVAGGHGYDYRLAWVLAPLLRGDVGSWEALVDARTGELIAFQDTNAYAVRRVVGGVYPSSNDQKPPDGVERPRWPMPFADVNGTASTFTTSGGLVGVCEEGVIQTTLDGQFIRIVDGCGPIDETSVAGDIDLGVSGGTDCVVPAGHSGGDTHAARTAFYELNRIKEQAKGHVTTAPGVTWLNGVLQATVNEPLTCGVFWNGTTIVTYRDNGSPCRNPGEIAGVLDHEFGHGLDDNDTNGVLSQPFEGAADIFANLRQNLSCVGRGIFKSMVCDGFGDECDGTPATGCTGVRDHDFMLHRCDRPHTVSWITQGFTSAECNGTGPAPACPTGTPGPCGKVAHCESSVVGETVWDLHFRDLRAAPFNLDAHTALELTTRLNYRAAQLVTSWYTCSVGGGCGATSGYLQFLAADDDNGNVADGTPHMSAIRAAFERHEIHCTTPAVADSGCAGGPTAATLVTATPTAGGADLTWGAVPGAASYAVYKTEGVDGCDFGKVKIAETGATSFSDSGLLDGRAYFYSVLPIGANSSCFGLMGACASVVPLLPPDPCVPVELQDFVVE